MNGFGDLGELLSSQDLAMANVPLAATDLSSGAKDFVSDPQLMAALRSVAEDDVVLSRAHRATGDLVYLEGPLVLKPRPTLPADRIASIEALFSGDLEPQRDIHSDSGDLMTVAKILGSVDIVVDMKTVLGSTGDVVVEDEEEEVVVEEPILEAEIAGEAGEPAADDTADVPHLRAIPAAEPAVDSERAAGELYARFGTAANDAARAEALAALAKLAVDFPCCATTLLCLGRAQVAAGRVKAAARTLRDAHDLAPDRADILAELRAANAATSGAVVQGAVIDPLTGELRAPERVIVAMIAEPQRLDGTLLPRLLLVFLAAAGALYAVAVHAGLGVKEHWLDLTDAMVWLRPLFLITFAVIAAQLFLRPRGRAPRPGMLERIRQIAVLEDLNIHADRVVLAVALGVVLGANLPLAVSKQPLAVVLAIALFHVVAEEAFFRGAIGQALNRSLVGTLTPALAGGFLYAAYQLTFFAVTRDLSTGAGLAGVGMSFAAGAIYSALHRATESFTIPFACHLTAAVVLVLGSVY